jgi:hypothetical protein
MSSRRWEGGRACFIATSQTIAGEDRRRRDTSEEYVQVASKRGDTCKLWLSY